MKKHNGMRPLDIMVLTKVISISKAQPTWLNKDLAAQLMVSQSEISESLNRSQFAGLIDESKKRVNIRYFTDFLLHGVRYVFPQKPGGLVRGLETAHSSPFTKELFMGDKYVWPDPDGAVFGQAVEPLYVTVPQACRQDDFLYHVLALVDMIRLGRAREINYASQQLMTLLNDARYY